MKNLKTTAVENVKPLTFIESMIKDLTPVTLNTGRTLYKGENDLVLEIVNGKLFNKGILREGMRIVTGGETGTVTMVSDTKAIMRSSADHIISRTSEVEIVDPLYKSVTITEATVKNPTQSTGNKQSFMFNGGTYSKSVLVRMIIAKYVNDNLGISIADLLTAFPAPFMGKFGMFKELSEAQRISGNGPARYFFKPEMLIDVDGLKIAVCNQMTTDKVSLIITMTEAKGYEIIEQK